MDLVYDWMKHLFLTNKKAEDERVKMEPGIAVPTPVVDLIFLTCTYFDQPDEVRCLSVELFDRFVRLHFNDLLSKVWNGRRTSPHKKWTSIEKTLSSQVSLRMCSCIQIASKFVFQQNVIKGKEIQKYLEAEGSHYTLASINASEIRVWKTLEFRANFPTVLSNAEVIVEQLKSHFNLNLTDIEERIVLFTDVVYMHHQEIFCKLHHMMTGSWFSTPDEKQNLLKLECNYLYRAAAVVALSLVFASRNSEEEVFEVISYHTNINSDDIRSLADIIRNIVLS